MNVIDFFRKRRTQYALDNQLPLSKQAVEQLIKDAVRAAPSAFNSQSSRVVILFAEEHRKLWHIVRETLRPMVPEDKFAATDAKMDGFAKGAGTVLFFEDQRVIQKLQQDYPLYADKFPEFSGNSAGMAQLAVWTVLANHDIGASLQHYHPLINDAVAKTWQLPEHWQLTAQMPFGSNAQDHGEKTYISNDERFRIFG